MSAAYLSHSGMVDGFASSGGVQPLFGTTPDSRIWCNRGDALGILMAVVTLFCLVYSDCVVVWLTVTASTISVGNAAGYSVLTALSIWSHIKTMLTDPGTLPRNAQPTRGDGRHSAAAYACGRCDAFKPARTHHCRTCGRCVVRMDHHCPWMNNCIGATNLKHFFLFLIYTLATCMYCLGLILRHFLQCMLGNCDAYSGADTVLVCIAIGLASSGAIFTFSMLINQVGGVLSGVGTVDRMQRRRKARTRGGVHPDDYRPVLWEDVFGGGNRLLWLLPSNVRFDDSERALGYSRRGSGGAGGGGGSGRYAVLEGEEET